MREIVESSTAKMWRLALTCPLLVACSDRAPLDIDAGSDAAPPAIDAPPGCGLRTGQRGKTSRAKRVAGLDRTYVVYLPPNADPQKPLPLVFVHHGYTMSAEAMFEITAYATLADEHGIAVAFPDGQAGPNALGAPWNVGSNVCAASGGTPPSAAGDDFALLDAIRADVALDQCIDDDHVFVTGFSMGGYFSNHTGCMRPDIRAIAPHSGGSYPFDACTSERKPVILFHGTSDTIVPDGCSDSAAAAWAAKNGCASTVTTQAVAGGSCDYYDGCPAGGQVAICTFTAMRHCWAGGHGTSIYACDGYEDATRLEWEFFKQHAW